jgi:hypothetical protein
MLVGMAMGNPNIRAPGLPDLFYAQRVRELVAKGHLVAEGNLTSCVIARFDYREADDKPNTSFERTRGR